MSSEAHSREQKPREVAIVKLKHAPIFLAFLKLDIWQQKHWHMVGMVKLGICQERQYVRQEKYFFSQTNFWRNISHLVGQGQGNICDGRKYASSRAL